MNDGNKVEKIREYLKTKFNECQIDDQHDFFGKGHNFRIDCQESLSYLVTVTMEFFQETDASEIVKTLEKWRLAEQLKKNPSHIRVTRDGLL